MLKSLLKSKETDNPQAEMSFLDHIDSLRKHLFRIALYVLLGTILVFVNSNWVFDKVILGPTTENFVTYKVFCNISETLCFKPAKIDFITRSLSEQFMASMKVSFMLGIIMAFPFIFYEIWKFVKPGLYQKEQDATRGVVFVCSLLFFMGVSFGYFIIAPFTISFLASYSLSDKIANSTTLASYIEDMSMFTFTSGFIFQLPLAVFFLAKIGIMGPQLMRDYRRHAIVVIAIVAAIITPPDVISMLLILIPILILYELSIFIAKRAYKGSEE